MLLSRRRQPHAPSSGTRAVRASGRARLVRLDLGATDELLEALVSEADKVGVDVPFGWPDAFVEAVAAHSRRSGWPPSGTRQLRFRRTDLYVQETTGKWPLSVSTDRIGITAFRAARFLDHFDADRTGAGHFVEVYPAAATRRLDLKPEIADVERRTRTWLDIPAELRPKLSASRDALDSLIASLVTRAAAVGLCDPIPREHLDAAAREGWIAIPLPGSLERLTD